MGCFTLVSQDHRARTGVLSTHHGKVQTPFFMPVCTKGSPKLVTFSDLKEFGFECCIANALLLHFKPGLDVIDQAQGLHRFVNSPLSMFTDSGGFQVIDEQFLISISDDCVVFKNPFSGAKETITPEKAVQIQNRLGSDVAMCLDDQPHYGRTKASIADACRRTLIWAKRCQEAHQNPHQLLFGISQGGLYSDLRISQLEALAKLDFDGLAIGGFGIGEPMPDMLKVLDVIVDHAPVEKPRYLMGIGSPLELVEGVGHGVDCFDSAFPTRMGRHGQLFTNSGILKIKNTPYATDFSPIDPHCQCMACQNHTRAYVHHLLRAGEPTGERLASHHNLYFLAKLMQNIRTAIKENEFDRFRKNFVTHYKGVKPDTTSD